MDSSVGQDIDGEAADDRSGQSVAMSADGSRIVIGARNNDGNGSNSGHVRIYRLVDAPWFLIGLEPAITPKPAVNFESIFGLSSREIKICIRAVYNLLKSIANRSSLEIREFVLPGPGPFWQPSLSIQPSVSDQCSLLDQPSVRSNASASIHELEGFS